MTNKAWAEGYADLKACCTGPELTEGMAERRGSVYRQDLDHLSDEQWLFAVSVARRQRWFPSIEDLLGYATECPPPPRLALVADTRSPDQQKADASKGLAMIQAELAKQGIKVGRAVKSMPVVDSKQRREFLKKQAEELTK
jgi:hypothetical protein